MCRSHTEHHWRCSYCSIFSLQFGKFFGKENFFFVQFTLIKKNSAIFFQILAKNFQIFLLEKTPGASFICLPDPSLLPKKEKKKKKKEWENSSITKVPAGRAMEKGEKWMKKNHPFISSANSRFPCASALFEFLVRLLVRLLVLLVADFVAFPRVLCDKVFEYVIHSRLWGWSAFEVLDSDFLLFFSCLFFFPLFFGSLFCLCRF